MGRELVALPEVCGGMVDQQYGREEGSTVRKAVPPHPSALQRGWRWKQGQGGR